MKPYRTFAPLAAVTLAALPFLGHAQVVVWPVNGHAYLRVDNGGIPWTAARTAAADQVYQGMPGHLVTVNSAEENRFLTEDPSLGAGGANQLNRRWMGGYQVEGAGEPREGWAWVTGEPFAFTNWSPAEPNDASPGEDHLLFNHLFSSDGKQWNDAPENYGMSLGYVVEFEPGTAGRPGDLLWEFLAGGSISSCPALGVTGTVYVGSDDGKLYALDDQTGQELWSTRLGLGQVFSPAIGPEGTVYVGSGDGAVFALKGETGRNLWEFKTGNMVTATPAIGADGTLYIGSWDQKLYALESATGRKRWEFKTGGYVSSSAAIGTDGTVYVGSQDWNFYAVNGATGQPRWVFKTGNCVDASPAIGADGTVYVGSGYRVYALDGGTGQKRWESATVGLVNSSPAIGSLGTVYVGSAELVGGRVYALDGLTGKRVWEFPTSQPVFSSPAVSADGVVYIGSMDKNVYALDGTTGQKRWAFQTRESVVSSPTIGPDGTVFVGSNDRRVYALKGSGPLAESPWPKFHGDAQNTGKAPTAAPLNVAEWAGNGHAYQRVDSGRITWAAARAGAEAAVYDGRPGHLVTINSAEENRFLTEHAMLGNGTVGLMDGYWLGGYQPPGSGEPAGGWRWITDEPFAFANWAAGEPNNMSGLENALVFWTPSNPNGRLWNDAYERTTYEGEGLGYVIEYEPGAAPDVTSPTLAGLVGDPTRTRLTLTFSEAVATVTATNLVNYALSDGLQALGARMGADGTTVILTTSTQTPTAAYTVTVNGVTDLAGNRIPTDSQRSFTAWAEAALGQFTFANRNLTTTPPIDAKAFDKDGTTPLSGTAYWTQAYIKLATDPEANYVPVGSPVHFRTGNNAGYIVPVVVTTPFPGGTPINVEMRLWESSHGDTYEAAVASGGLHGKSLPITLTVTAPPTPPADMLGLQSWCELGPPPPPPPWITNPTDVRVMMNDAFMLSVSALNAASHAFQWYRDGQPLIGHNESVFSVARAQLTDAGGYHVTVTNFVGSATSGVARVVVGYPLLVMTNGAGRVEVSPPYVIQEPGQQVVLKAIPEKGHVFQGWQGDVAGTANPATLVMDRTKQVQARFTPEDSRVKWQVAAGGTVVCSPAIGWDGTLYVNAGTQALALNGASGAIKWTVGLQPVLHQSPAIGPDGTVYVGSSDRHLHALDGATGASRWTYATGNNEQSTAAVGADGTVYIGCTNLLGQATITALDGAQGTRKWEFLTESWGDWSLAVGADGTIYAGAGTNLFALDGQHGTRQWAFGNPRGMTMALDPAIDLEGTVYAKAWNGELWAISGATGGVLWQQQVEPGQSGPVIGFEDTLFTGGGTNVYALDVATGAVKWQREGGGWVTSAPTVAADNTVYVASGNGRLYALDGATGVERWRFEAGSSVSGSPAIGADGTVYLGAYDGTVYALRGGAGLAPTTWPKFRCDAQNTGQAPAQPPVLLRQPFLAVLTEGAEDRITVQFSGIPLPHVQWYFNGDAVPDGTNTVLQLPAVTRALEGLYAVVASNWLGRATSAPVVAVVSNVDPAYFPAWRWEGGAGAVSVLTSTSVFGPWTHLFDPPTGATSGYYVETQPESPSLYYRFREESGATTARFTATAQAPGWWYEAAIGSRHRIEYVWRGGGWTNWMVLAELTLPASPQLFLDTDAFEHPGAVYRTTPGP